MYTHVYIHVTPIDRKLMTIVFLHEYNTCISVGFTNCLRCVVHVEARVSSIGPMCLPGDLHDFHHAVASYLCASYL